MATVLLVDDSPAVLRSVELALKAIGHEVLTAESADRGLERLQADRPDIMVVDVMMPTGTEGFHLIWEIRQLEDETLRSVPIIMATGIHEQTELRFYPEESDGTYQPGEFLPVQGWLDKPIQVRALAEKIEAVLWGPAAS